MTSCSEVLEITDSPYTRGIVAADYSLLLPLSDAFQSVFAQCPPTLYFNKYRPVIKFDYIILNKGMRQESRLMIGKWINGVYTPCNRKELEWHLIQYTFDAELAKHGATKYVERPQKQ